MLDRLTVADVLRGMADFLTWVGERRFDPPDWEHRIGEHVFGARPMVAYAAMHSVLKFPLEHLAFTGDTDEECRRHLEGMGFRFSEKS